jgi:hypothetical protein
MDASEKPPDPENAKGQRELARRGTRKTEIYYDCSCENVNDPVTAALRQLRQFKAFQAWKRRRKEGRA